MKMEAQNMNGQDVVSWHLTKTIKYTISQSCLHIYSNFSKLNSISVIGITSPRTRNASTQDNCLTQNPKKNQQQMLEYLWWDKISQAMSSTALKLSQFTSVNKCWNFLPSLNSSLASRAVFARRAQSSKSWRECFNRPMWVSSSSSV